MICVQTVLETQQETMTEDSAHVDAAMVSGCNQQSLMNITYVISFFCILLRTPLALLRTDDQLVVVCLGSCIF